MSAELVVLLHGEVVGRVREGRDRSCWFSYTSDYTLRRNPVPLSLTMPLAAGRYDAHEWMEGLLPTRMEVIEHWAGLHGAESLAPMDMLATPIGWDCAGAVQFCADDEVTEVLSRPPRRMTLTHEGLRAHLESVRRGIPNLPDAPPWAPFSLAGAQAKTALHWSGSQWSLPTGGMPSTHILKVAMPDYRDNDLIEHVCMRALRRSGVPAARTEIVQAGDERAIAVERYDRRRDGDGDGPVRRIHQEDLCQALGFPSTYKYQRHGGPSPQDIAEVLGGAVDPRSALGLFRDALVCSWMLAASDAHAKNYSLLLVDGGYALAPLYDVCSMAPYKLDTQDTEDIVLAMTVGDAWSVGDADGPGPWRDCSEDLGVDPHETLARVEELAEAIPLAVTAAANEMPAAYASSPQVGVFVDQIQSRLAKCRDMLAPTSPDGKILWEGVTSLSAPAGRQRARRQTRCPHTGRRSGRRCIRRYRHRGQHRYR